jgi:hypothetical protein
MIVVTNTAGGRGAHSRSKRLLYSSARVFSARKKVNAWIYAQALIASCDGPRPHHQALLAGAAGEDIPGHDLALAGEDEVAVDEADARCA